MDVIRSGTWPGVVERVGPARWRLVLPWPRWESNLDVMELVPATGATG
jgi:hypothetical protein